MAAAAADAPVYDRIAGQYRRGRQEDPRIAAPLWAALGDASPVVNVGADGGSYEPRDRPVVAVEPSAVMLAQRPAGAAPAVRAVAEALPFGDGAFGAAIGVLTLHHRRDRARGLAEMRRVAPRAGGAVHPGPARRRDLVAAPLLPGDGAAGGQPGKPRSASSRGSWTGGWR